MNQNKGLASAGCDGLRPGHLRGGSIIGELSDLDLDVRMARAFRNYVPGALFYRVRTEECLSVQRCLARGPVEWLLSISA